jgi:hypothetical protein
MVVRHLLEKLNDLGVCTLNVAMCTLDVSAMNRTKIAGLLIVKICLSDGSGSILLLYTDFLEFTHRVNLLSDRFKKEK